MGSSAGKGDDPRPVDKKKYDETMDRIFGVRDPMDYHKDGPHRIKIHAPVPQQDRGRVSSSS